MSPTPPSRPALSQRARRLPASPIRRLAPFAAAARAAGRTVLELNIGQPDIPTPPEILGRLATLEGDNIAYGPSEGLPAFVDAILRYHAALGIQLDPKQVFATTGGSEALLFVMAAVCDPGDEVVVFEPFYTNYTGFSELVSVRTVPVTTRCEDGYHLPDEATIEAAVSQRTRAIVICTPNNPTGTVYTREEMDRIASICRRRNLFLISDEVYREFTYDGVEHISALNLPGLEQHVVVTDSLSKRVSMCGARVGWIASRNAELMSEILKMGQARLCPPTVEQTIAAGFADIPPSYMEGVVREYRHRRDVVLEALQAVDGVVAPRPEGSFYICTRLPIDDGQDFAEFLLKDFQVDGETVMFAPADGFYATEGLGRDEIRIAYVLEEQKLRRAMRVLTEALAVYPGRMEASSR